MKNEGLIFFTVGTKKQKIFCERIIAEYQEKYELNIIVIADEELGCRIGSGGAVLNILSHYFGENQKIAIINSGGKSKRVPNYAAKNKAFANLKIDEETVTLFELILVNIKNIFSKFESGALIACSDILINGEYTNEKFDNNIGFCTHTDLATGTRHGVMFCDEEGFLFEYPHKVSMDELRSYCTIYGVDEVLIDTGLLYFNGSFCADLVNIENKFDMVQKLILNEIELNVYSDIVPLLCKRINKDHYLNSDNENTDLIAIKNQLFTISSAHSLKVHISCEQDFYHFGSLIEAHANIIKLAQNALNIVKINSAVDESCIVEKNTVLDNVILKNGCKIGKGCIISDISLSDGIIIKDNMSVCGIRLNDGSFVSVILNIEENPKSVVNSKELWETELYYKGTSFVDSLNKFYNKSKEIKFSLKQCIEAADLEYYSSHSKYIKDLNLSRVNQNYLFMREKILENHFDKTTYISDIVCTKQCVDVCLPLRVNLSGTWTDAMPYCIDNGGQVINMAITVEGELPITVTVEKISEKVIEFCSDGITKVFDFKNFNSEEMELSDFNLHIAALKTIGITQDTAICDGFRLTTSVKGIDKGSGLGTSSILLGGCIKALNEMLDLKYNDAAVLKMVFVAEQIMGTGGGWQDQVGGLLPSIKSGTTFPGIDQDLYVEYIDIPSDFSKIFAERMVIIPTGQRHFGRFIVSDVADRYLSKAENSILGHSEIRKLNSSLIDSICKEDYYGLCSCLNRHFELLKMISPRVSNQKIDSLVCDCLCNIADGVSICGAGGGGYLLAILKDGVTIKNVQEFINKKYPNITSPVKQIQLLDKIQ